MATRIWDSGIGATDLNFLTAANWSDNTAPIDGDTAIIASTSDAILGNLATGLDSMVFRIGPGFTGTLGTAALPLDIDCTTFDFESGGQSCYVRGDFTTVNVKGGIASSTMLDFGATPNAITTLRCMGGSGKVNLQADADVTNLVVIDADGLTIAAASGAAITDLIMDSGNVTITSRTITTATVRGGVLTLAGSAAITTLNLEPGGVVNHQATGAIGTFNGYGGFFDGRDNENVGAVQIGSTAATIWEGCELNVQSAINNFTAPNGIVYNGGKVFWHRNSTITFT